ncbi:MAG TPA: helix-turn-helix transcriptional regulator [Anaerolineae bacterium]
MKLQDIVIIRLRMARRELHLSQVQASTRVGLSQTAWANYETGARGVSLAMLDRISRAFGKPVEYFLTLDYEERQQAAPPKAKSRRQAKR